MMDEEIKNIEDEKVEEKEKEKEYKESIPWISKVPPISILVSALIQFLLMMYFRANDIATRNLIWTCALNIGILFLMAKAVKEKSGMILDPDEAYLSAKKAAELRKRQGRLPPNWNISFDLQDGIKIIDSNAEYYNLACKLVNPRGRKYPMQATVFAQGPMKGFTTFQLLGATLYGTERERVIYTFSQFEKHLLGQKGFNVKDYLFGKMSNR